MQRSRGIRRSLWLLRGYGNESLRHVASTLVQGTATPSQERGNLPGNEIYHVKGDSNGQAFSRSLSSPRPSLLNLGTDLMGLHRRHFSSAQPLPAKSSEDRKNLAEPEIGERHRKISATAVDVDKALEDYDRALEKHRKHYASRYETLFTSMGRYIKAALNIIPMTWKFLWAIPRSLWKAIFSPWTEKKLWMRHQWRHLKEGAQHYWVGTKLLVMDLRVASRMVVRVLRGKELTRREKRQFSRTVADLFRMVPMIIFLVVPFLEFLLPVAIALFPNMLPSTFEDKLKKEEHLKKRLVAKLEVAQFLQDTVAIMAKDLKQRETGDLQASADDLYQFMKDIRRGVDIHNEDIIRFAQLFKDEFTLDNLDRVHLVSICQLVGLSPFGTDNFLRSRIQAHLGSLKRDDLMIHEEGLESLTTDELRQACRARAIRALYGEKARGVMIQRMKEWLELSLDKKMPPSLLLLSRAFTVTQPIKDKKTVDLLNLAQTMSTLPDEVVEDVQSEVASESALAEKEKKLELLHREEERIKEESEAAEQLTAVEQAALAIEAEKDAAAQTPIAVPLQASETTTGMDTLQTQTEVSAEEIDANIASTREHKLKKVLNALTVLTSTSGVCQERSRFMGLMKKEIDRLQDEMQQKGGASLSFSRKGIEAQRPAETPDLPEEVISTRLQDRVAKFMHKIEKDMDKTDQQIGEKMHLCDLDGDGKISLAELEIALGHLREELGEPELEQLLQQLCKSAEKDSRIDVNELMTIANQRFHSLNAS